MTPEHTGTGRGSPGIANGIPLRFVTRRGVLRKFEQQFIKIC
jgi:hypothetical protein